MVEAEGREKGFGRVASGFPSSLDAKRIGQGEKRFQNPWTTEREIPSRSSPSLGRFAKEIRKKARYGKGLGDLAKIQIQI
jgi:hypothetical protein